MDKYRVIETPMFPRCWKIEHVGYTQNNAWTEYFRTREDALAEIARRGGTAI